MNSLALAVVLQASLAAGASDYRTAHAASVDSGRPLVVLVGADWCPGCQQMKTVLTPDFERRTGERVVFARVDADSQPGLAQRLMRGAGIPQLVMYRKTEKGWKARRLIGAQSQSTVASFIQEGIRDSAPVAEKKPEAEKAPATQPVSLGTGG
ncbi:MAG: thioredoxin family protein [Pirellulales bacterium]